MRGKRYKGTPNLGSWQQPLERGSPEGHQRADTEWEAVVEQGGVAARGGAGLDFLGLLRVLLQVGQLETAAQQQVQEVGLQEGQG